MLFSLATSALAAENPDAPPTKAYYNPESNTEVILQSKALHTPQETIDEIIRENPNSLITLWNHVESQPQGTQITPFLTTGLQITSRTTTASNYVDKDSFVISVAKGSQKSLTTTWTQSLSASAIQSMAKTALNLNGTITKKYNKTETFSGPPESSKYNSREFRVRFYADKGTYKGYYITEMGRGDDVSGDFKNPLRYAEYSIDKKV